MSRLFSLMLVKALKEKNGSAKKELPLYYQIAFIMSNPKMKIAHFVKAAISMNRFSHGRLWEVSRY